MFVSVDFNELLVGGFNQFEKYFSKLMVSLNRGETRKYLKTPPRLICIQYNQKIKKADQTT